MAYENVTKDVLLQRMLDQSPDDLDKREGSITYDLLSPAAIELAESYIQLDRILTLGFADTTYGPYLDLRCSEMGVTRKLETKATGQVTFSGPEGTVIPAGTQVSTATLVDRDSIVFTTVAEVKIPSSMQVMAAIEAVVGGAGGNVDIGEITIVIGNLSSVLNVMNDTKLAGGTDKEEDEQLLSRYLQRVREAGTSGNVGHYLQWAKEVPGISRAIVQPLFDGPGSVKVIVLSNEQKAPPSPTLANVENYIQQQRPIGAAVTVEGATEIPMDITVELEFIADNQQAPDLTSIKQELTEKFTAYFAELAFNDPIIRRSQIGNMILDIAVVKDYHNLLMNSNVSGNIAVDSANGEVAVLNSVTVTEKV
ncbi:baseplate J/gp47 family protein [Longirhabdus pacifica]|uniref:baseplate J/gp47 family protein n=1 Tax=Longirhabdus pacifica TaxID=2305227 RepID=UPI00100901F7|nr:baseplate J/gp47 family protein [Longirhabdus pacifica]